MESLKILIADDNDSDRMILSAIVKSEGHQVIAAIDGVQAIEKFVEFKPDIILLDALMPNKDGFEAADEIKTLAGNELVPIIFLTSLQDAESLSRALDSGGDDFLSKPYNRIILKAKIKAFSRMRVMHEKIQEHNRQMIVEQKVAKTIFDNVAHQGCLESSNLQYSLSPLAVFNGDTVLAERKPDGGMHLFLGDFTGHGLPAAIGAMPLAEIFYGMTAKGFSAEEILIEINAKLGRILPVEVFCCACMVDMDFIEKSTRVFLGGLPEAYIFREKDHSLEKIPSSNLPLGVMSVKAFKANFTDVSLDIGDRLFMWSDGIIEARASNGDMFGEERLEALFHKNAQPESLFDNILKEVDVFLENAERDDDITLLVAKMAGIDELGNAHLDSEKGSVGGPMDWNLSYDLYPQSLKIYNPLPLVLHILTEVEGLRPISGQLYTLLAELYSNGLEHGILGLDSKLKQSALGFAEYYGARQQGLEALKEGHIKISINHKPHKAGGLLTIRFEDSGPGFNYQNVLDRKRTNQEYSGRGLPLIQTLCKNFQYFGSGNIVEAQIEWPIEK